MTPHRFASDANRCMAWIEAGRTAGWVRCEKPKGHRLSHFAHPDDGSWVRWSEPATRTQGVRG